CGVNDLDHGSQANRTAAFIIHQLCRKEQKRRPDPFSSATTQILADLRNRGNARDRVPAELVLQCDEIVPQQIEYFFAVDGGRSAQNSVLAFLTTESQSHRDEIQVLLCASVSLFHQFVL